MNYIYNLQLLNFLLLIIFFFNNPATTEIYTLSLHDALPIYYSRSSTNLSASGANGATGVSDMHGKDRKSTRLNSSHVAISYAVFCLKKKNINNNKQIIIIL